MTVPNWRKHSRLLFKSIPSRLLYYYFLNSRLLLHKKLDLSDFPLDKSTVCRIVHRVSTAILKTLFPIYVRWKNNSAHIPVGFPRIAGFPRVAGAVDGTLIPIQAPRINKSDYVDRHGNHSINVMVVCGSNYEFLYASARWPGSVHDNRVLRNSTLFTKWEIDGNKYFMELEIRIYCDIDCIE